jgi:hypothetical protein
MRERDTSWLRSPECSLNHVTGRGVSPTQTSGKGDVGVNLTGPRSDRKGKVTASSLEDRASGCGSVQWPVAYQRGVEV